MHIHVHVHTYYANQLSLSLSSSDAITSTMSIHPSTTTHPIPSSSYTTATHTLPTTTPTVPPTTPPIPTTPPKSHGPVLIYEHRTLLYLSIDDISVTFTGEFFYSTFFVCYYSALLQAYYTYAKQASTYMYVSMGIWNIILRSWAPLFSKTCICVSLSLYLGYKFSWYESLATATIILMLGLAVKLLHCWQSWGSW